MAKADKTKTKTFKNTSKSSKDKTSVAELNLAAEQLRIDLESQIEDMKALLDKRVEDEVKRRMPKEEKKDTFKEAELILGQGEGRYKFASTQEGLIISQTNRPLQVVTPAGSLGFNTSAPKVVGPGSMHIKSNYNSEAALPTDGSGTVRGLLLESDADDDDTFSFRAVSRRNRQGLNLTGDGSLSLGLMWDSTKSKLSTFQTNNDTPSVHAHTASRYFQSNMIDLEAAGTSSDAYNFLEARNQCVENGDKFGQKVFSVTGKGTVQTDQSITSNKTGYAEMFEWADGNPRLQDRTGYTVAIDATGKLIVADEGDVIIGVVVDSAAFIGGTMWNHWQGKYAKDDIGNATEQKYHVVEWETANGLIESHFDSTLPRNFRTPDNATVFETDIKGRDMTTGIQSESYKRKQRYMPRMKRQEWVPVLITGTVLLYKGQQTDSRWVKLSNEGDDLERWLIK